MTDGKIKFDMIPLVSMYSYCELLWKLVSVKCMQYNAKSLVMVKIHPVNFSFISTNNLLTQSSMNEH